MSDWESKPIGRLGRVVTGKTPPTENRDFYSGDEFFISPKDLDRDTYYVTKTETRITTKALEKFKNQVLPENSVLFTSLSFAFGKMGITSRPSLTNQQINSVIVNDENDFKFVYYLLRAYEPIIFSYNSGIDTPIVPKSVFESILVSVPGKAQQRKIAAILSAYDDLIENNRRRIALLEKMAEEIYREWFVRLRFPGHEQTQFEKGLPVGWSLKPFSELVTINPSEPLDKTELRPFVGMEDLSLTSMFFRSKEERRGNAGAKFRNNDVLFPRITPSLENGKRGFVLTLEDGQVGLGSTEFIVFRERILSAEHIYLLSCSCDFRKHAELSMSGASGRQRVAEDCFTFFFVKVPPEPLRKQFSAAIRPLFDQIGTLAGQLNVVAQARDALLPRLISGKLPVDALDIRFPSSMPLE